MPVRSASWGQVAPVLLALLAAAGLRGEEPANPSDAGVVDVTALSLQGRAFDIEPVDRTDRAPLDELRERGKERGRLITPVRLFFEEVLAAPIENQQGRIAARRWGASVLAGLPISDRVVLVPGFDYTQTDYRFRDTVSLVEGAAAPFGNVHSLAFGLGAPILINDAWSAFVRGGVAMNYEDGAERGDAATFNAVAATQYRVNDFWHLGAGVVATTRLNGDPFIIGFPTIEYRPWGDADLVLEFGTRGPSASARWQASDAVALSLRTGFETLAFRLRPDDSVPGGSVTESDVFIEGRGQLRWKFLLFEPALGVRLARDYEFFADDDREIATFNVEPALYLSITAAWVW